MRHQRLLSTLAITLTLISQVALGWRSYAADEAAAMTDVSAFDRRAVARAVSSALGLPPVPVPAGNLLTAAKIRLGRQLFFDRRLSLNDTMSCAMCHVPEQGFTVNELAQAVGVEGRSLRRNAPTLLNVAYMQRLFHDGREFGLETQVIRPLLERHEMANPRHPSTLPI